MIKCYYQITTSDGEISRITGSVYLWKSCIFDTRLPINDGSWIYHLRSGKRNIVYKLHALDLRTQELFHLRFNNGIDECFNSDKVYLLKVVLKCVEGFDYLYRLQKTVRIPYIKDKRRPGSRFIGNRRSSYCFKIENEKYAFNT
jgi:hypothetical protein